MNNSTHNMNAILESGLYISCCMFMYASIGFLRDLEHSSFPEFDAFDLLNMTTNILYLVSLWRFIVSVSDMSSEYNFNLNVSKFNKQVEEEMEYEESINEDEENEDEEDEDEMEYEESINEDEENEDEEDEDEKSDDNEEEDDIEKCPYAKIARALCVKRFNNEEEDDIEKWPRARIARALGVKRFNSAYFQYLGSRRSAFKEENPELSPRAVVWGISREWNAFSDAEKEPYVQMSQKDKERYNRELDAAVKRHLEIEKIRQNRGVHDKDNNERMDDGYRQKSIDEYLVSNDSNNNDHIDDAE